MRKQSDVWSHWEEVAQDDGTKKWQCRYCQSKPQNKNATKCSEHTIKCQARINAGVDYYVIPNPYSKNGGGSGGKRKRVDIEDADLDEASSASRAILSELDGVEAVPSRSSATGSGDQKSFAQRKQQAFEIITDLLFSDEQLASKKKPINMYTDEDFKKEERELRLKELRLSVRQMQLKNQLLERLLPLSERASDALDRYMAMTEPQIHDNAVYAEPADPQQVAVIYSNHEGDQAKMQQHLQ